MNLKLIDERDRAVHRIARRRETHIAKALALLTVQRGYATFYREALILVEDINQARDSASCQDIAPR